MPWCGASGVGRSPTPDHSSFGACGRGPPPAGCGCRGCGRGDPSPTPQRALLRAGFARCGGGTRGLGGGASCLGVGRPGTGALPPPTTRPFRPAAGAHYPLAVGAVCGRGGLAVLGSLSRAAVCGVYFVRFRVRGTEWPLWLGTRPRAMVWPAACLSGVPRGHTLVRSASSGPVALGALVGFSCRRGAFPQPGGDSGWLRGARGGRPRTGLIVPAASPCRGKGAGRAPRSPVRGPAMGLSVAGPSGFGLQLRALRWFGVCGPGH